MVVFVIREFQLVPLAVVEAGGSHGDRHGGEIEGGRGGDELDASRSRARSIDETEARARSPRDVVVTFRPSQIHRSTSNIALFFTGRSLTGKLSTEIGR
jgi:hypothetical protein